MTKWMGSDCEHLVALFPIVACCHGPPQTPPFRPPGPNLAHFNRSRDEVSCNMRVGENELHGMCALSFFVKHLSGFGKEGCEGFSVVAVWHAGCFSQVG